MNFSFAKEVAIVIGSTVVAGGSFPLSAFVTHKLAKKRGIDVEDIDWLALPRVIWEEIKATPSDLREIFG